jgi:hypothetical protein
MGRHKVTTVYYKLQWIVGSEQARSTLTPAIYIINPPARQRVRQGLGKASTEQSHSSESFIAI